MCRKSDFQKIYIQNKCNKYELPPLQKRNDITYLSAIFIKFYNTKQIDDDAQILLRNITGQVM